MFNFVFFFYILKYLCSTQFHFFGCNTIHGIPLKSIFYITQRYMAGLSRFVTAGECPNLALATATFGLARSVDVCICRYIIYPMVSNP